MSLVVHPANAPPVRKAYTDGSHRTRVPAETLERVLPLRRRMGITRLANVTGLDRVGVPVFMSYRPNSRLVAVSSGKGLTVEDARASALMESVEAYHAERLYAPLIYGSRNELRDAGYRLLDTDALVRMKDAGFNDDLPVLWIEGVELLNQVAMWAPFDTVHTNYSHPLPTGSGSFAASTNGLASGNHLLEAMCHALQEIIERDATTMWRLRGTRVEDDTRVDLTTVDDPECQRLIEQFDRAEIGVEAFDVTSDVGVATFACRLTDRGAERLGHLDTFGLGCHLSRRIALLRAMTEAAQVRVGIISGARDDLPGSLYDDAVPALFATTTREAPGGRTPRRFEDAPDFHGETFNDDAGRLLECVREAGFREVVAFDLTKADIGVPVSRVVIPGMELAAAKPATIGLGARARRLMGTP
jgi:ribosomal protein S12 methylthiotransferase accessory factor